MLHIKDIEDFAGINEALARRAAEEEAARKSAAEEAKPAPAFPATALWDPFGLFGTAFLVPRR